MTDVGAWKRFLEEVWNKGLDVHEELKKLEKKNKRNNKKKLLVKKKDKRKWDLYTRNGYPARYRALTSL